jgi:hypothetical protein
LMSLHSRMGILRAALSGSRSKTWENGSTPASFSKICTDVRTELDPRQED